MTRPVQRLNWGSGGVGEPGWINADLKSGPGVDITGDVLEGLPLDTESMDFIVSIHALPEIHPSDQVAVLRELRRVLRPGGALRLALPDLLKGIAAYERGDRDYFLVPDEDARSMGAKLVTQLTWYGYSRTLFVPEYVEELLVDAGFAEVRHVSFQRTTTDHEGITDLDNREAESLFVEAIK